MQLAEFYNINDGGLKITVDQASNFAKSIANDFNPLHDPNHRRFCVPGDLLFTALLQHYGISQQMHFRFSGMVGKGVILKLEEDPGAAYELKDADGKTYLHVGRSGSTTRNSALIDRLVRRYVAFSGQNFPHILVPLFEENDVMVNIERPMVIYESMAFELDRLDIPNVDLRLADSRLESNGKRGDVRLRFEFLCGDTVVGTGCKRLLLSGLRPYDKTGMAQLVATHLGRRDHYASNGSV
jgi:hypothetical protein